MADPRVPGVSVITVGPAKGHFRFDENDQPVPVYVDSTTLEQVMACAKTYQGGLRVNAGHFTGVMDAAAFLDAFRIDGNKVRADMTLFKTYEGFEHLCELVATISDTFGLSIDFSGPYEIRDGKAFARCVEIYSADLVTVPAANDRGLFGEGFVFSEGGKLQSAFDNQKSGMELTPEQVKQITDAIGTQLNDAVGKFNQASENINAAVNKITGFESKLGEFETKFNGLNVPKDLTSELESVKKTAEEAKTALGDTQTKLQRRLGIEFAARAGANPTDPGNKTGENETRKGFEIPASETNAQAIEDLLGK